MARTIVVFLVLGPPIGLINFIAASFVGALFFQESEMIAFGTVSVLRFEPALTTKVTYMVGAPAAGLSGGLVAWLLRKRQERELLWVVLAGSIAGSCYALFLRLIMNAAMLTALHIAASSIVATLFCWAVVRAESLSREAGAKTLIRFREDGAGARTVLQREPRASIFCVFLSIGPLLGIVGLMLADILEGAFPKLNGLLVLLAYVTGVFPAVAVAALASRLYVRRRRLPLLPLLAMGAGLSVLDLVAFNILAPAPIGDDPRNFELAYRLGRFLAMHLTAVLGCWGILNALDRPFLKPFLARSKAVNPCLKLPKDSN
jgi:hypothetical protein